MNNRFEPIETVLAASAVIHGLWLMFPGWSYGGVDSAIGAPRSCEIAASLLFITVGTLSFVALGAKAERMLRAVDFLEFLGWTFFAVLTASAIGLSNILWVPYATLSLLAAFVYLGLSIGGLRGTD